MRIEDARTVTVDEASYEVTKALLPFLIEADREYAKHRLEMVWATSITTIESPDDIVIRIKKFKERN